MSYLNSSLLDSLHSMTDDKFERQLLKIFFSIEKIVTIFCFSEKKMDWDGDCNMLCSRNTR